MKMEKKDKTNKRTKHLPNENESKDSIERSKKPGELKQHRQRRTRRANFLKREKVTITSGVHKMAPKAGAKLS